MKKKFLLLLIILIPILLFGMYKFIEFLEDRSFIISLDEYSFLSNEKIIKEFEYKGKTYGITTYYDESSSWSHIHFLLKDSQKYYILENVKKCDTALDGSNIYVKENEIYIHCIGKEGNIDKYLLHDVNIEKETLHFNFKNTPNISQMHMGIDNVDNEYIYLSSFKLDNTVSGTPRVKCSLNDKICLYY